MNNKAIYQIIFSTDEINNKDISNYEEASRIISNFNQNNKKSVLREEILTINDIDQGIEDHVNDDLELTKYYENNDLFITFMNKSILTKIPIDLKFFTLAIDTTYKLSNDNYSLIVVCLIKERYIISQKLTLENKELKIKWKLFQRDL